MKNILLFSLFITNFFVSDISKDIVVAIQTGNVKELSKFFSNNIDMALLEKENVYSKAQAEMILKEFFDKHSPKTFTIIHQGTSKTGVQYGIGSLITNNGKFRVSFYIKNQNNTQFIHQLRIDAEE